MKTTSVALAWRVPVSKAFFLFPLLLGDNYAGGGDDQEDGAIKPKAKVIHDLQRSEHMQWH
jgi:hypothetical protein